MNVVNHLEEISEKPDFANYDALWLNPTPLKGYSPDMDDESPHRRNLRKVSPSAPWTLLYILRRQRRRQSQITFGSCWMLRKKKTALGNTYHAPWSKSNNK